MGKAVLIYGATFDDRVEVLRKQGISISEHGDGNDPDFLVVEREEDKKSVGIAKSREIKKFLREKPLSSERKTVVILHSELLTTEAQNALLKTLEEPPEFADIFLLAKTENSLLETVISRCVKKAAFPDPAVETGKGSIALILKMPLGERLDKAKEIAEMEKDDILQTLESWVMELRELSVPKERIRIETVIKFKKDLEETNVNTRLALEALLLVL